LNSRGSSNTKGEGGGSIEGREALKTEYLRRRNASL